MSISVHPGEDSGSLAVRSAEAAVSSTQPAADKPLGTRIRTRLFTKYVALFVSVVAIALLSNGVFEVFFYYREHKAALIRIQHEQAEAAAAKISQFIKEIESQLGWTTQLPWSAGSTEQRRFDALRLLRQVPAITELAQVDSTGKERLRVSRLAMDVVDSGLDLSKDPKFSEAAAHKVYYGPVYFRRESEPYMTLSLAGARKDAGVSIAEVNLKLIWDVVSQIKVGEHGHAYVVGSAGRLIAHPDISLVLRNTDMSKLAQVTAAQAGRSDTDSDLLQGARNIQGQEVLTASAPIAPLGWTMFVELPVEEAYASLYAALQRLALVLAAASLFAVLAGIFLARRMVGPIQALRAGAERIGSGDFAQRISIRTGDELEGLANQFNDMGARLQESYADLESKVERRTAELSESLQQQTATADVLKVISRSAFDLESVLTTLTESAKSLCSGSLGIICLRDGDVMRLRAQSGCTQAFVDFMHAHPIKPGRETITGRVFMDGETVHVADVQKDPEYRFGNAPVIGAYRAVLAVPLMRDGAVEGVLLSGRPEPGPFSQRQIDLVQTFADQAVIAIENVRLFEEVQAKTRDLEEALTYQTGSANILRVIASSPTNVEPVLEAIVESARELCEAADAVVLLREGEYLRFSAHSGPIPVTVDRRPIGRGWTAGLAVLNQKPVHIHDMLSEEGAEFPDARVLGQSTGETIRTVLSVPLLREKESIGAILLRRTEVLPFNEKQVNLLSTFADQAVIAIENTRLFNETQDALARQTATSDILRVISGSPTDVQPVFDAIVRTAVRLIGCDRAFFMRVDGQTYTPVAGVSRDGPIPLGPRQTIDPAATFPSRAIATKQMLYLPDWAEIELPDYERTVHERHGVRSSLLMPLLRGDDCIGLLALIASEPEMFGETEIALAESFRDQALIAIENTRLFNETQEALERQTATTDILKVIASSPSDVRPVFEAIATRANSLVGGFSATVFRFIDGTAHLMAFTPTTPEADEVLKSNFPSPVENFAPFQMARDGEVTQVPDTETLGDEILAISRARGFRSMVFAPLMNKGKSIGLIAVTRLQTGAFSDHHVQLLQTFADQAVIAIENVRLFDEVQARTKELSLSLDELRTAQDRLVQTEKLASLGQLTAGIAHEIKNPLNFVNNFSAVSAELIDELKDLLGSSAIDDRTREDIDEIMQMLKGNLEKVVQHGKRADSIVKNMLLHSREGSGELRSADINAIVEESLNLAYHGARAEKSGFNITLARDFDPAAGSIELYPQEITRVFLNLISNGFYAATKRSEAGEAGFEPTLTARTKDLGREIEIRIRDNGTGIPADVREKMFNPFFTTKPAGEGTGLGLSMSHDIIVKQHRGKIDVITEPGAFTEFIVTLPRSAARTQPGGRN